MIVFTHRKSSANHKGFSETCVNTLMETSIITELLKVQQKFIPDDWMHPEAEKKGN